MNRTAKIFISGVLVTAIGVLWFVLRLDTPFSPRSVLTAVVFGVFTVLAYFTKPKDQNLQAWNANKVFFFAGALLLPPRLYVLLVVASYALEILIDTVRKRTPSSGWYSPFYNAAVHLLAGSAMQWVFLDLTAGQIANPVLMMRAAFTAGVGYFLLELALVSCFLVYGRGMAWRDLEILSSESLFLNAGLLTQGFVIAVLWQVKPVLIMPALVPLLLIYRSLALPRLKHEAQTDEKTGLLNARYWQALAEEEVARAQREGIPLALVMADLDLLRFVNNSYGHLAGDELLQAVGKILREETGSHNAVGRFGGEEFAILLPGTTIGEAQLLAERLRRTIEQARYDLQSGQQASVQITMSLGVAALPEDGQTLAELIHQADLALIQAKLHGRNRVAMSSDVPHSLRVKSPQMQRSDGKAVASSLKPLHDLTYATSAPRPVIVAAIPWLVSTTALLAVTATALGTYYNPAPDWNLIIIFACLAMVAEVFALDIYGASSVSVGTTLLVAVALTAGMPGLAIVSAGMALVHFLRRRPAFYKTVFNWAADVLAGSAFVVASQVFGLRLELSSLPLMLLPVAAFSLFFFVIETGLVALALTLSRKGRTLVATWREMFQWLASNYVVLGVMGLFLAASYEALGFMGVMIFVLPIALIQLAQWQYLDRTEKNVLELRRMNAELSAANREIEAATGSMRQLNDDLFLTLSHVIDARDPYVLGHANQVAEYAVAIATVLGLSPVQITAVRQAGLLHDIGKIAIADRVLHKPDRLTPEEYEYIKTHAAIGATMLENSQSLRHLAPFVRHHHEHWDGRGYPDRLSGDDIPLESRILAVSDAVEAMASDRPYNRARSLPQIIEEVKRYSGSQFDPTVVAALIEWTQHNGGGMVINSARKVSPWRDEADGSFGALRARPQPTGA